MKDQAEVVILFPFDGITAPRAKAAGTVFRGGLTSTITRVAPNKDEQDRMALLPWPL